MIVRATLTFALVLSFSAIGACGGSRARPVSPAPRLHYEIRITTPPKAALRAAWTQYGPNGVLEVRAVIDDSLCPQVAFDLHRVSMQVRAAGGGDFPTLCAATIPVGAQQAALAFGRSPVTPPPLDPSNAIALERAERIANSRYDIVPLALATPDPQRILVLGDTGCRIKGKELQDCSDPTSWPFPVLAAKAARLKPDLVIHVGDYLYRESPCPADFKGCQGTPFGDNWPTWDADFFAPAAPLLAAAPWVMVRGNHEDCARAAPGFLRLIGPLPYDPAAPCPVHMAPFSIPLQNLNLVVTDNVDAPEKTLIEKAVPVYAQEFASLVKAPDPTWLLLHRPIWGLITGPLGVPIGGNLTLMAAATAAGIPAPVSLMLSGHIHSFEAINYESPKRIPPQIVAGFGGDRLDPSPDNLRGAIFQGSYGVGVKDGISVGGFGFLLMTKTGQAWTIDVYDWQGQITRQCLFHGGRIDCPPERNRRR